MNIDCCCKPLHNLATCGCCEGIELLTPLAILNRPGLLALSYRIGTHATFLESMKARLSNLCLGDEIDCRKGKGNYPLRKLTTREADDFSIAMLDAWATVGDVLTFYQERIANEGYLRTAIERRSVLEMARLVGYKPRPGVAASVYLAYTIDPNYKEETVIPTGSRSQSIPGPGELPQSFETSEDLKARAQWNNLQPRMSRPQTIFSMLLDPAGPRIFLHGTNTNLKPNDPLMIDFVGSSDPIFIRIKEVIPDPIANHSLVRLETAIESLVEGGQLITSFNFNTLKKQYDVEMILLDRGDGLPGFFLIMHEEMMEDSITLFSISGGSKWKLVLVKEDRDAVVKLENPNGSFVYKIEAIDLIRADSLNLEYFRIKLQSIEAYGDLLKTLALKASIQPSNALRLKKDLTEQFAGPAFSKTEVQSTSNTMFRIFSTEKVPQVKEHGILRGLNPVADGSNAVFKTLSPILAGNFAIANANADVTIANPIKVYALRQKTSMFGSNAPDTPVYARDDEGMIRIDHYAPPVPKDIWNRLIDEGKNDLPVIATDTQMEQVQSGSWLVIDRPTFIEKNIQGAPDYNRSSGRSLTIHRIQNIQNESRSAQGISSKTSVLTIGRPWLEKLEQDEIDNDITVSKLLENSTTLLRSTLIYAQSEELALAEEPVTGSICGGEEDLIELNGYYEDLQAGRWVIVSGERADVVGTRGVISSELVMLSVVKQDISRQVLYAKESTFEYTLPEDKVHTFIKLAKPLAYCFKRDTVKIYGNVVKATHGETRNETLGSGNGSKSLQQFNLKQPPLTFVPAPNPSGVDSTLKVYVNDVQWYESETLVGLGSGDRRFVTRTDDDGKTAIICGNGNQGARLPTGIENIRAVYRNGIGKGGNVKAEQISLLSSRPLGIKEVTNPLPASGGADKETRDQARKNAPLAVMALDRLVSVQDYEDFTRIFAGIGKAQAVEISDGRRQIVHLTIAGVEDIPIETHSDLYRNLTEALRRLGDPYQPFRIELRELMLLVLSAKVCIQPDYLWEKVEPNIRDTLLDIFSFERRELGQDALLSEAIAAMQSVRGVSYVDVDSFGGIPEKKLESGARRLLTPAEIADEVQNIVKDSASGGPKHRVKVNLADYEEQVLRPAQLAYFTPLVPATLILNEVPR